MYLKKVNIMNYILDGACEMSEENKNTKKLKSICMISGKGAIVGGSMLVPGVSGGSMAMILGIYDKLIDAVSNFFKHIAWSLKFLSIFCLSALLGMLLFAKPLLNLIERFPMVMMYFFIGAVFGSIPMMVKKAEIKKMDYRVFLYPIIGFLMMTGINLLPEGMVQLGENKGITFYLPMLVTGIIVAIALVLPGISVSYMLLVLGVYEDTMKAISEMNFSYLMPLTIGVGLGIILTTKLLEQAMTKQPGPTYMIILGFIIASCIDVFPGVPKGVAFFLATLLFFIGAYIMYRLSETVESV